MKPDAPEQLTRKPRPFRDFNVQFADLNDTRPQTKGVEDHGNCADDDDLPKSHDILRTVSTAIEAHTPPSETNYSNSDIDSLIRAVPLDDNQEVPVVKSKSKDDDQRPQHGPGSLVLSPSTPPPSLKRNREVYLTPPFKRRNKLAKIGANATPSPLDEHPHDMV